MGTPDAVHLRSAQILGLAIASVALMTAMLPDVSAQDEKKAAADKAPDLSGVVLLNRYKCDDGYTLYSSRMTQMAHLIDIRGREVHRWSYPQGDGHSWHYAEMQPNGHLVAMPKNKMILELDWDSNLVWKSELSAHHDVYRYPNGNTIVLSREKVTNKQLRPDKESYNSSVFVELTPDNEVVWKWHLNEHVIEMAELISDQHDILQGFSGLHTNSVEVLPDGPAARKDARFNAGNVLFSCKKVNTIGVLDKAGGKVVWAWWVGPGSAQHMPTMLPNGHILLYDNNGHDEEPEHTRIIELDPITEKVVWEYWGDPPDSFYSRTRGSNQRLPNGNTFIAESDSGRLFEVTPEGEIVWEFLNPDRHPKRQQEPQPLYRAIRYRPELVERLLQQHGGANTGGK